MCLPLFVGLLPWTQAQAQAQGREARHHAEARSGYLGVIVRAVSSQSAARTGGKIPAGVEVVEVDRDAPAGRVGLVEHDVILSVDGHLVASSAQLGQILAGTHPGQEIHLRLEHQGVHKDITVKLASREQVAAEAWPQGTIVTGSSTSATGSATQVPLPFAKDFGSNLNLRELAMVGSDGLDVEPLSGQLAKFFGASKGMGLLVRNVEPKSHAALAGLRAGDVITAINGMTSGTLQSWLMVLAQNQGKPIQLEVIRNHRFETIRYTPQQEKKAQSSHN